jgi:acyl-CoA reductase-like NAD-dependent aldehyde dehydrogenase
LAGKEEVDRAVKAARAAWPEWRGWAPDRRRDVLYRLGTLIRDQIEQLSPVVTLENGTPSAFAPGIGYLAYEYFLYYAGWTEKIDGSVPSVYPGTALDYTVHEPYGVIGVIMPWNGPLGTVGMKVAPALAAGNCVVLKAPELAPFSSLRFAELALEAGLPPGVVNVFPGNAEAGQALVSHPGIDKISFTGGTETGKEVMRTAADNLTPVVLELGGKSATILFADADLDAAVPAAVMFGLGFLSGQVCMLGTRLLVEDSVYEDVLAAVGAVAESLVVGDPLDPTTQMGPVISERHCQRIVGMIERAASSGAGSLVTGGERLGGTLADGYYLPPTVFGAVDPTSEIAQEEVFGPVLSVIPFSGETEAVRIANSTRYGLAGYVWTGSAKRAHRMASQLEAGAIGLNGHPLVNPNTPFGGYRSSGFGREGGRWGLQEFLRTKNVQMPLD